MDPEGKVAIVTGGSSGIGRATAIALAAAGASVVVADVNAEGGGETVSLIEQAGGRAAFVKYDVTSRNDLEGMVAFAEQTYGGLDILHNNAGIRRLAALPGRVSGPMGAHHRRRPVVGDRGNAGGGLPSRGGGVIVSTSSMAGSSSTSRTRSTPPLPRRRRAHGRCLPEGRSEHPRELHLPWRRGRYAAHNRRHGGPTPEQRASATR
jgi:NAD(P)-dependent dehydrogenase (short-subunit alcohol dehydrogenase family)